MKCSKCKCLIQNLLPVGEHYTVINGPLEETGLVVAEFKRGEFEYRSFVFQDGEQSTIGYEWMPCNHWAITQRSLQGTT